MSKPSSEMSGALHAVDYVVIVLALVLSSAVGLYYGVFKKKNDSMEEYFFASRELSTFMMACSYFATAVSSNTLIGYTVEIYYYGSQILLINLAYALAHYIFLQLLFPVFFTIGSHDIYKFYELKFGAYFRYLISTITIIERTLMCSGIIYGTATVLSKVTGIHIWIIITVVTSICVFYSAMGGVRGVTLADMIQASFILVPAVILLIVGLISVGGISVAWQRNWDSGRIELFNFDFDPTTRHTFWTSTVSFLIFTLVFASNNPSTILRVMGSNSFNKCKRAVYYGCLLFIVMNVISVCIGLVVYSKYYQCDPFSSGSIADQNQLISIFVSETSSFVGYQGLFYAGILCSCISTLSSIFNALSALAIETFVRPFISQASDQNYIRFAKISVGVIGGLCLAGTMVVAQFTNVYQAMIVLLFSTGPQFVLFLIGIVFPRASVKSCIGGYVMGVVFMLWLLVGSLLVKSPSNIKPISTAGCISAGLNTTAYLANASALFVTDINSTVSHGLVVQPTQSNINSTTHNMATSNDWVVYFPLSATSFNWFITMGVVVTFVSFAILSLIFGGEKDRAVDVSLIPDPVQRVHKKLSKRWRRILLCDVYDEDHPMAAMQCEKLMPQHLTTCDNGEGTLDTSTQPSHPSSKPSQCQQPSS